MSILTKYSCSDLTASLELAALRSVTAVTLQSQGQGVILWGISC